MCLSLFIDCYTMTTINGFKVGLDHLPSNSYHNYPYKCPGGGAFFKRGGDYYRYKKSTLESSGNEGKRTLAALIWLASMYNGEIA